MNLLRENKSTGLTADTITNWIVYRVSWLDDDLFACSVPRIVSVFDNYDFDVQFIVSYRIELKILPNSPTAFAISFFNGDNPDSSGQGTME